MVGSPTRKNKIKRGKSERNCPYLEGRERSLTGKKGKGTTIAAAPRFLKSSFGRRGEKRKRGATRGEEDGNTRRERDPGGREGVCT